jgi:hypothetical protein
MTRMIRIPLWLIPAFFTLTACDPCSGVALCFVEPHVGMSGRLLNDTTGKPISNAAIDLLWAGGVRLERDSVRVVTDANGLFEIDVVAAEVGESVVNVAVQPPSAEGYRVIGLTLRAAIRGGEARVFPPWTNVPQLPDFGEAFRRGAGRENLANAEIEFRPTSGVALRNLPGGVWRTTTNGSGLFPLFGGAITPVDVGDVIGDLTIFLPPPLGASVHRNYRVKATADYQYAARIHRVGAGPSLEYRMTVKNRGNGTNVEGARVDFVRTGGIDIDPPTWSNVSDVGGNVLFTSRASERGIVIGNITVTPPAPFKSYTSVGRSFATFEADSNPVAPAIEVGLGLPYYAIVRANGVPLQGVNVDFQRTSGINVTPATFTTVTDSAGIVFFTPEPASAGEVVADVTVRPPAPYATFTVRGVRMQTADADVPEGRRLVGDWEVTNPPASLRRLQ